MIQNRPAHVASLALALAFGFALGFGAATWFAAPDTTPVATSAEGDVETRARAILNGDAPLDRLIGLGNLLTTLDSEDVPALLRAFEATPLDGGDPELVMLALWWSGFDPAAALKWTSTDWRAGYGAVIAAVFRGWSRSEPQKAFEAAKGLRFAGQQDLAMDAAIAGWDESAQKGLMEYVMTLASPDQQRFGEIIARRRVLTLGPEEAIRWANELPDAALRDIMRLRVASAVAATPSGAPLVAEWVEPFVQSERLSGYPRRVATRWVLHDPAAAMAWLASLPAGDDRDDGVTEGFRDWSRHDFEAAGAWAHSVEPARWNEPARSLYARMRARRHPEEAVAMAMGLEDPKLRNYALVKIGRVWTEVDPDAAKAWFAASGLPPDLVQNATVERRRLRARDRGAGVGSDAADDF